MSADRVSAIPSEGRSHQGMRAGIVSRVLANSADCLVLALALIASYAGWAAMRFLIDPVHFSFPAPSVLVDLIVAAAYLFVYFTASWATTGRTYGNHLMGLRVVNFRGEKLRWIGAMLRAAGCVLLPIGLFWAIVSRQNRSVQDVVLRTSVIYDWGTRTAV